MKLSTDEEGALIALAVLGLGLLVIGAFWGLYLFLDFLFRAN